MIAEFDLLITVTILTKDSFMSIPTRVYLVDVDTVICECRLPLSCIPDDIAQDMANMLAEANLPFRVHHVEYIGMLDLETVICTDGVKTWTKKDFSI